MSNTYPGSDLAEKGFVAELRRRGHSERAYHVTKPTDQPWPAGSLLVNFCGGVGNFGGHVTLGENDATVTVYID